MSFDACARRPSPASRPTPLRDRRRASRPSHRPLPPPVWSRRHPACAAPPARANSPSVPRAPAPDTAAAVAGTPAGRTSRRMDWIAGAAAGAAGSPTIPRIARSPAPAAPGSRRPLQWLCWPFGWRRWNSRHCLLDAWATAVTRASAAVGQYYAKNVNLKMAAWFTPKTRLATYGRGIFSITDVPLWTRLAAAQMLQNRPRGEAVGHQAHRCLELPKRNPGLGAQPAVRLADVVTAAGQKLLQFVAFGACKHALMSRPWLHEGLAAT